MFKGHSVQKTDWKQTDGRYRALYLYSTNMVGKYTVLSAHKPLPKFYRYFNFLTTIKSSTDSIFTTRTVKKEQNSD